MAGLGYATLQNILEQRGDPSLALKLTREAAQLASGLGHTGLGMVARSIEGIALITAGEADAGLTRLDEVAAAVAGGEVADLLSIGFASCNLIAGYDRVRDYPRAVQWCERLKAFCRLWNHSPLFAVCRTLYADVLIGRGQWHEAEQELASAAAELARVRPAMRVDATVRLAELRRRRGQYVEARALLQEAEGHPLARLVAAELALDEGCVQAAIELTERFLRGLPVQNLIDRATALELLIRAEVRHSRGDKRCRSARAARADCASHRHAPIERFAAICAGSGSIDPGQLACGETASGGCSGRVHTVRGAVQDLMRTIRAGADIGSDGMQRCGAR
jgi:tetratricopeptide (TPR) repeat protein